MVNHVSFRPQRFFCSIPAAALASFFFFGHLLGVLFSGIASEPFLSSMRMVVSSRVSIVGLVSSVVLPFLFSAFAVFLGRSVLLFPIAFWKAFLFSYLGYGLFTAWGSAGWLIAGLVMFGSVCSMPVLYWYWLRGLDGRFDVRIFSLALGLLLVIAAADHYFVAPFLADIINF